MERLIAFWGQVSSLPSKFFQKISHKEGCILKNNELLVVISFSIKLQPYYQNNESFLISGQIDCKEQLSQEEIKNKIWEEVSSLRKIRKNSKVNWKFSHSTGRYFNFNDEYQRAKRINVDVQITEHLVNLPSGYFHYPRIINPQSVPNFTIQNQFGKVVWMGRKNIEGIDFSEGIRIHADRIECQIPELKGSKIIHFYSLPELVRNKQKGLRISKKSIENDLNKFCRQNDGRLLNHGEKTGFWMKQS